ncbi:MAG: bifunctional (p)ppGpp synthetase/guanosine-3',5'-bis(diphosphate) 3'-pyrophosphohydrolase [Muribaculaceae bacterium]|nr:bifunctional (p)ppGpp synthetase/guanosine-3',5'-bis(diphosphate) 3'-pyrophosphohydrolase [Muribaculaceae bacterium]
MSSELTHISPKIVDTPTDEKMIEDAYRDLLDGYLASNHRKKVDIINRAFKFAKEAHKGVRRRSGEPYIMHPIAVAKIVSQEIGLGSTSICAALLHDVVEDTDYTVEDIESQFGKKIASLVEGLTKISGGIFGDKASVQAENFRKLLLTMADDIRVILIKMADRLHNMRTLGSMLPSKQIKISGETFYIYAPLAHRLGLFNIKTELEDLSFKYEHPEAYKNIQEKIAATAAQREHIFEKFAAPIKERLTALGLNFDMKARVKSIYSIWNKMETKHIPFEEVYDLYAARIIFDCDNEADEKRWCWNIYSEITNLYKLHPERTRDWVSTPKVNGYRALHLTVMGNDGNWIEVQIRSKRMNELAERGFAAHWKYKIGEGEEESELAVWLKTIQDILSNPEPDAMDFLDTIKLNLFSREIVVFTPKGELITLPSNATVLDFAFNLHTYLGTHCIAGKVNHKLVPLSHKLKSGDQVEVLTSKSQQPQPEWIDFLNTAKGKIQLRAALRKDKRQIILAGKKQFLEFLANHDIPYSNEVLTKICGVKQMKSPDDLYAAIANGEIELTDNLVETAKRSWQKRLLSKVLRNPFSTKKDTSSMADSKIATPHTPINTKEEYVLHTIDGKDNYIVAECCKPIPGDNVIGYIDDDNNVIVHKLNCPEAMKLKSGFGNRIVTTRWENVTAKFMATINIRGIDRMGMLQEIIQVISQALSINIRQLNMGAENGVFDGKLEIIVEDTNEVTQLCKKLLKLDGVKVANRID